MEREPPESYDRSRRRARKGSFWEWSTKLLGEEEKMAGASSTLLMLVFIPIPLVVHAYGIRIRFILVSVYAAPRRFSQRFLGSSRPFWNDRLPNLAIVALEPR